MDGQSDTAHDGEQRPVERELVQVLECVDVPLERIDRIAGLEINEPTAVLEVDPVEPGLAQHAVHLAAHHALRDALGQQLAGEQVLANACGHLLDRRGVGVGQHGLAALLGPLGERLSARAIRLACLLVDRPADRVLGLVALASFEDQRVRCPPDEERMAVPVRDQPHLLAPEQKRARAEVRQPVRRQAFATAGVICLRRLTYQDAPEIETPIPMPRRRRRVDVTRVFALAKPDERVVAIGVHSPASSSSRSASRWRRRASSAVRRARFDGRLGFAVCSAAGASSSRWKCAASASASERPKSLSHCRVVKIREPKRTCLSRTRVPDAAFTPSRHHRQTQLEDGRPGASLAA